MLIYQNWSINKLKAAVKTFPSWDEVNWQTANTDRRQNSIRKIEKEESIHVHFSMRRLRAHPPHAPRTNTYTPMENWRAGKDTQKQRISYEVSISQLIHRYSSCFSRTQLAYLLAIIIHSLLCEDTHSTSLLTLQFWFLTSSLPPILCLDTRLTSLAQPVTTFI